MILEGKTIEAQTIIDKAIVQLGEIVTEGTLKKMAEHFTNGHVQMQALRTYLMILERDYLGAEIKEKYAKVQLEEIVKENILKRIVESSKNGFAQAQALRTYISILDGDYIKQEIKEIYVKVQLGEIVKQGALKKVVENFRNGEAQTQGLRTYIMILKEDYIEKEIKEKYARVQLEEIIKEGTLKKIVENFKNGLAQAQGLKVYILILEGEYVDDEIKSQYVKKQLEEIIKENTLKKIVKNFRAGCTQADGLKTYILILKGEYIDEHLKETVVKVQLEEIINDGTLKKIVKNFRNGNSQAYGLYTYIVLLEGDFVRKDLMEGKLKIQLEEIITEGVLKEIVGNFSNGEGQSQGLRIYAILLEEDYIDESIKKGETKKQLEEIIKEGTLKEIVENFANGVAQAQGLRTYILLLEEEYIDKEIKEKELKLQLEKIIKEETLKRITENLSSGTVQAQGLRVYMLILEGEYVDEKVRDKEVKLQLEEIIKGGILKKMVENFASGENQVQGLRSYIMFLESYLMTPDIKDNYLRAQLEDILKKGILKKIVGNIKNGDTQTQGLVMYRTIIRGEYVADEIKEKYARVQFNEIVKEGTLKKIVEKSRNGSARAEALRSYLMILETDYLDIEIKDKYVKVQLGEIIKEGILKKIVMDFKSGIAQGEGLIVYVAILENEYIDEQIKENYANIQLLEIIKTGTLKKITKNTRNGGVQAQGLITYITLLDSLSVDKTIKENHIRPQLEEIIKDEILKKMVSNFRSSAAQLQGLRSYRMILEGDYVTDEIRDRYVKVQLEEIIKEGKLKKIVESFRKGHAQTQGLSTYALLLEGEYIDNDVKEKFVKVQLEEIVKEGTLKKIVNNFRTVGTQAQGLMTYLIILESELIDVEVKVKFAKVQLEEIIKEGKLKRIIENFRSAHGQVQALRTYITILEGEYIDKEIKERFVIVQLEEIVKENTLKKIVENFKNGASQAQGLMTYIMILESVNVSNELKNNYVRKQLEDIVKDRTLRKIVENFKNGNAQVEGLKTYILIIEGDYIDDYIKERYAKAQLEEIIKDGILKKMVENFKNGYTQAQGFKTYIMILENDWIDEMIIEKYVKVQLEEVVKKGVIKKIVENFKNGNAQAAGIRIILLILRGDFIDSEIRDKYARVQVEELIKEEVLKKMVGNFRSGAA